MKVYNYVSSLHSIGKISDLKNELKFILSLLEDASYFGHIPIVSCKIGPRKGIWC